MAIKYLSSLNLGGLEVLGLRPQHFTTTQISALTGTDLYTGRVVYDSTTDEVKFYDGSAWQSMNGDIRSITAGSGLTGTGTSGDVTLNVGAGTGIAVNADDVALSHLGLESLTDPNADAIFFWDDSAGASAWLAPDNATGIRINGTSLALAAIPNSSLTNSSLTVTAGAGLTTGGSVSLGGSVTVDVGAGTGITVNANDVALKNAGSLTTNTLPKWTTTGNQLTDSIITDDGSTVTVAGNLTVTGTTTTVNSNTVEIGDNIIVLNSDEAGAPSQNAGFEVERGTSANVSFIWNESSDYFSTVDQKFHIGSIASVASVTTSTEVLVQTGGVVEKVTVADIATTGLGSTGVAEGISGDGSTTAFAIDHNLGTRDVVVQVYDSSNYDTVYVDTVRTTINRVTVTFAAAPAVGEDYRVVITRAV